MSLILLGVGTIATTSISPLMPFAAKLIQMIPLMNSSRACRKHLAPTAMTAFVELSILTLATSALK